MAKAQRVMILVELRGWMEEFMVQFGKSMVKDAQARQEMLLPLVAAPNISSIIAHYMKTSRDKKAVKWEGGDGIDEGSPDPSDSNEVPWRAPRQRLLMHKNHLTDSLLESKPFSAMVGDWKCSQSEDKWRKLYGPLGQWCPGKYHHDWGTCKWSFTASIGPITNLMGSKVTCIGVRQCIH